MRPTKDDHALVELLDVLLEEGVVVQADVVVTVADIPLIGISLRAAVAGMATLSEHGLFAERDVPARNPSAGAGADRDAAIGDG